MLLTILIFVTILSVVVLIHELGHFLVAKKLGVKIEEFGFGLPPRIFGKKIGETTYSINLLPIGGFVKLFGEDEAGAGRLKTENKKHEIEDVKRAFFAKKPSHKAAIVVAGVVMNALLAVIIFYTFLFISNFKTQLPLFGNYKFLFVNQKNISDIIISGISKNSPAEKAGIKPFSKVESINNQKIADSSQLVKIINSNKGKEMIFEWSDQKTGKKFKAVVVPRVFPPKNEGALGVSFFPVTMANLNYETPAQKIFSGFVHPVNLMAYNFDILGKLIGVSIKEKSAAPLGEGVSGPIGVYSLVGNIVQIPDLKERVLQILNLAGILSISLAFFNILPFPALDGGRLSFILVELFTRKKVNPKFEGYAHAIGMAILLTLIVVVTFHDLIKIFSNNIPFLVP
ncbi:MAG: site-2 protease family protein [bacterium]|nr:site-2 protease family protein [bacterium]